MNSYTILRSLALCCHPIPTLGVTAISAGLAAVVGLSPSRALLVVVAVFAGQLSIGWSNDFIDAARDRVSKRTDKPVARGAVSSRLVAISAGSALLVAVVLSFALGLLASIPALTLVTCGWLQPRSEARSCLVCALRHCVLYATGDSYTGPSSPGVASRVGHASRCALRGVGTSGKCSA